MAFVTGELKKRLLEKMAETRLWFCEMCASDPDCASKMDAFERDFWEKEMLPSITKFLEEKKRKVN